MFSHSRDKHDTLGLSWVQDTASGFRSSVGSRTKADDASLLFSQYS